MVGVWLNLSTFLSRTFKALGTRFLNLQSMKTFQCLKHCVQKLLNEYKTSKKRWNTLHTQRSEKLSDIPFAARPNR